LPELFIANTFVQIYCRSVELTKTELMIFKYLYSFYGGQYKVPAKYIYKYCFPKFNTDEDKIRNNVAVNIKKINQKFQKAVPGTIIKSRREHGYYITQI
ncbi:MAG: helix-turn-helix domain-containing protein, partial [Eubacteriales bacterium]